MLYEQLAQHDLTAYAPNLAWGFNNLSVALVRSGELAEGMAAIHRAVDINERLAQQDFVAHASRLAGNLDNLSHALAASGEHAQALDASRRAVEIHERLRREGITIHAPAPTGLTRRADLGERAGRSNVKAMAAARVLSSTTL